MRLTLVLLALPLLGAAPPSSPEPSKSNVARPIPAFAARDCRLLTETGEKGVAKFRRLGDLPTGRAYAAMWRTDEKGCPDPALYRQVER